jgi:hypothetical protein
MKQGFPGFGTKTAFREYICKLLLRANELNFESRLKHDHFMHKIKIEAMIATTMAHEGTSAFQ